MGPRISVVVNTLNEERNLPAALSSVVPWADEVVVVDMESDDRTLEIARSYGARTFSHPRAAAVDAARGYAIERATGDWVLLLDADELVPIALSRALREVAEGDAADVVMVPRENYLLGGRLEHTGWGPDQDRIPRFFKPAFLHVSDVIHRFLTPAPGARILELSAAEGTALVHFNYLDSTHFIHKLNRYTSVEAAQAFGRGERATGTGALVRAAREFIGRYIGRRGYRDGWRGFYLSLFMAFYRIATAAKLEELRRGAASEAVEARYREIADRLLDGYRAPLPTPRSGERPESLPLDHPPAGGR